MPTGPTVGQYHFAGWDLPTKYGWMHSGAGVQAATEVQDVVQRMADRIAVSGERVRGLLTGAEWMGTAAEAAAQAMRRGAAQLTQTATGTATAERCVTELGESFQATRNRVPAPNEIPTGLGDQFLFGAAEGFSALSPFDVQSPLHEAMEQRRELDRQANQALTDHMTTSRDRIEAMPVVVAPAPMTVAAQGAGAPGGGSAGQLTWATSAGTGTSGVPASAPLAATLTNATAASAPSGTPGTGGGVAQFAPGASVNTAAAQTAGGGLRPGPSGPTTTGTAAAGSGSAGGAVGHLGSGGRSGGGASRSGARTAAGGEGAAGRGNQGPGGPPAGAVGGSAMAGHGGGAGGIGGGGGARTAPGAFLQPAVGSRGSGADAEHRDRYVQPADHIIGELPLVAPAVIGETAEEELRLRRARDGR
jgi:hypothetical protein